MAPSNGEEAAAVVEEEAAAVPTPYVAGEEENNDPPVSTILVVIGMQTEALPVVNKFQLQQDDDISFPKGVPWVCYYGTYKDLHINLVWPGKDPNLGVDSVGTISASLVTYAAVQALHPDLIINAGTAGGFKVGRLSTGNSLDMSQQDEVSIIANDALIKDMEGAAVAYVADLFKVSTVFVKAVTDIVDGNKPTAEEFLQNSAAVTAALDQAVTQVVDFINGKRCSEL